MTISEAERLAANTECFSRMTRAEPVLQALAPAAEVVPGFLPHMILTSGPRMAFVDYVGGQKAAILGAAQFEGRATSNPDAEAKFSSAELLVFGCQEFGCVGSLAGVYSSSMDVFVVRNGVAGNSAFCNMYEGTNPRRLNYGVYDAEVHQRLSFVKEVVAPVLARAIRNSGGISLKPIMRRALQMGDELHSRNAAAALLFFRDLVPYLLPLARDELARVDQAVQALTEDQYFFLRLSMAAAKLAADAAHNVQAASVVTGMAFNCKGFAIRVSGLGDRWFIGPHASVQARLFEGHSLEELAWMGGESTITETVGLGGFAQAAAFPLQQYQGGSPEAMVERNLELYQITVGEHPDYRIPFLRNRGTPTGIDIFKVLRTGILPVMDIGIAGQSGGQIGAGVVRAPIECFAAAAEAYQARYGQPSA